MKTLPFSIFIASLSCVTMMAQASARSADQTTTSIRPSAKAFANANKSNLANQARKRPSQTKSNVSAQGNKAASYSTSHSFEGSKIQGQLQEGSLRRIMVENDKSIDDLLGIRKQFDDRELEETERNLSW